MQIHKFFCWVNSSKLLCSETIYVNTKLLWFLIPSKHAKFLEISSIQYTMEWNVLQRSQVKILWIFFICIYIFGILQLFRKKLNHFQGLTCYQYQKYFYIYCRIFKLSKLIKKKQKEISWKVWKIQKILGRAAKYNIAKSLVV